MQKEKNIRIEILIPNSKDLFYNLFKQKDEFEDELGLKLEWNEGIDIKRATIFTIIENFGVADKDSWASISKEIVKVSEKIRKTFIKFNKQS